MFTKSVLFAIVCVLGMCSAAVISKDGDLEAAETVVLGKFIGFGSGGYGGGYGRGYGGYNGYNGYGGYNNGYGYNGYNGYNGYGGYNGYRSGYWR